jgi:hypothetical protein
MPEIDPSSQLGLGLPAKNVEMWERKSVVLSRNSPRRKMKHFTRNSVSTDVINRKLGFYVYYYILNSL